MIDFIRLEPAWLQAWIAWMVVVNSASVLFVKYPVARWTLAAWIGNALFMGWLFEQVGYVRLLGLSHLVFWTPLLGYLWWRRDVIAERGRLLRLWAGALAGTISISLVVDAVDVVRYLAGDGAIVGSG